MSGSVDLNPDCMETVMRILAEHVPECEVRAFGSRATWTAKGHSDLDLAIVGEGPLDRRTLGRLEEAFEESSLPMRVDVLDWHAISESFREVIERDCVVVQEEAKHTAADQWREVTLGDVVDLRLSSVDKKTKPNERAIRLCNYTDVYNNSFINGNMDFMAATASDREISNCSLFAGDVVITKDSETHDDIGVPALVREDIPNLVCGYHLAILRPSSSELDGAYLFYALRTGKVQRQFHSYANGITRFGLRKADIGLVEIPLPPLPEQRAIAHVLGTLDDKIELNRRMNETLESMARAIFQDWFVDFGPTRAKMEGRAPYLPTEVWSLFPDRLVDSELGEIPDAWGVRRLEEVVEINPARLLRKGAVVPYLDMANMPTNGHRPDAVAERPFGSGMRFANGDTLVARITPCLENGKTAYVDFLQDGEVGWGSTEYIVMKPKPPLPEEFAYCLARSVTFREFAIQNMTGTSGRQRVPVAAMFNYQLPLPSECQVAELFGELVKPLFSLVSWNTEESRTLSALRDALLPGLVSGEVGVGQSGSMEDLSQ